MKLEGYKTILMCIKLRNPRGIKLRNSSGIKLQSLRGIKL